MYLMRKPPNTGVHEARILVLFLIQFNKEFIKQRADTQFSETSQNPKLSGKSLEFSKVLGFWIFDIWENCIPVLYFINSLLNSNKKIIPKSWIPVFGSFPRS